MVQFKPAFRSLGKDGSLDIESEYEYLLAFSCINEMLFILQSTPLS